MLNEGLFDYLGGDIIRQQIDMNLSRVAEIAYQQAKTSYIKNFIQPQTQSLIEDPRTILCSSYQDITNATTPTPIVNIDIDRLKLSLDKQGFLKPPKSLCHQLMFDPSKNLLTQQQQEEPNKKTKPKRTKKTKNKTTKKNQNEPPPQPKRRKVNSNSTEDGDENFTREMDSAKQTLNKEWEKLHNIINQSIIDVQYEEPPQAMFSFKPDLSFHECFADNYLSEDFFNLKEYEKYDPFANKDQMSILSPLDSNSNSNVFDLQLDFNLNLMEEDPDFRWCDKDKDKTNNNNNNKENVSDSNLISNLIS